MSKKIRLQTLDEVTIRFAGDSGDGMQLSGGRFTQTSAIVGNDLSTLPDFPAEIRAPAGSLAGVSSFQIHFSSKEIHTPGERPDVLVAMNPAALKVHLKELVPGGILILNKNAFTTKNLKLAGYESDPTEDGSLDDDYAVHYIEMSKLVANACEGLDLPPKTIERTKNLCALGVLFWMYDRPLEPTIEWLKKKFKSKPQIIDANTKALHVGYNYGETAEITTRYIVEKANLPAGKYRNMNGTLASCLGILTASEKSKLNITFAGYPITPASNLLHTLSNWKNFGVKTFQAEDEIASVGIALGASFGGSLGITASSGPGISLKTEFMGLAVITELPLVVINVQRGGPSTGLPTKTEQSDLLQALYGRNGDAPLPVIAPRTPGDCYFATYEACRIAVKYMTPVVVLSDGYLANGSEPWLIPNPDDLNEFTVNFEKENNSDEKFLPYKRDDKTLSRPWAIPGTKGLEHRIGGIETEHITGNVAYTPDNHQKMTDIRHQKIKNITNEISPTSVYGKKKGDLLILSWGSPHGACRTATEDLLNEKYQVGHVSIQWVNPLPSDLKEILGQYKKVLIPEINAGQLIKIIRGEFLVDAIGLNEVRGQPLNASTIVEKVKELINE
ncbi:MAG: 2-oxoacid:acceptor oxidoreductase subunit alpha [Candidatus Neomarinimicrobiota bacterium]|nr:2-oxoacid:acceptor oxidoreductase subunit alpha [Candidatus Neomarinimicrobiota bacterium]MEC9455767.1 2-oxoacid:acceptor oxidoreductase subunit alpha [Candidatus Neomarinimicrobiota bacterium]MED5451070.1 2-oxoacid:acceptor oxidoreductase subunit alpha [Candidatus Neomarinimicrobiota bacterium]